MTAQAQRNKPHVALAIGSLHNTSGGAERVLVDVANGLHRRGYEVTVLTYQDRNGPSFYPLDYGIARFDGRVRHSRRRRRDVMSGVDRRTNHRPLLAGLVWIAQHTPRIFRLWQLLRRTKPDVTIGFMPSMFPYLTVAGVAARRRVIASIHNVPERELGGDPRRWSQNPFDIWVRNRSLRWASATTVLLPSFVEQLDPEVRPKTFVVPNMVRGFGNVRADVRTSDTGNEILAVGRLAHAKDHETLIRAWALVEARYPTWSVRIIGRGPLHGELHDLIDELGLERLTIEPPTDEIERAYASAKLVAMPSVHEGFGLVTAEAMTCGLPVVGFADCEGTNEIILPGVNGVLVDPDGDRARSLAVALTELIEDEQFRLELASSAPGTTARYDEATVLDQWEHVINSVTQQKVRP